jgi:GLPGLI family protein
MARIFFLLVVLFNFSFKLIFAQKEGTVTYYYIHKNLGMRQPSHLKFKNEESVLIQRQDQQVWPTPGDSRAETTSPRRYNDWYLNSKTKKVIRREILKDSTMLFAHFDAQPMEWEIKNETKTILGYKVQKATAKSHLHSGKGDNRVWLRHSLVCPRYSNQFRP